MGKSGGIFFPPSGWQDWKLSNTDGQGDGAWIVIVYLNINTCKVTDKLGCNDFLP